VGAESLKYRFQWTFPILFSRHAPNALYACSNYVHRSMDLGASWEVISPDLTRNDPTKLGPSGGPVTRDNTGAEVYCTVFALAESPHEAGVLWAGSDDGLLHLTRDGGTSWTNVTPGPDLLPEWALISIIEPSPHDPATAYVAATRYKLDDLAPYLLVTTDYGATWRRITHGLPDHEFTRVIREDPNRRDLLYCGTETGLYVSFDAGAHWQRLGGNLPVAPVYDLVIKGLEMVVATHGRSFWILDDLSPLHQLGDVRRGVQQHLFQPRPTHRLRLASRRLADDAQRHMVNYARADASLVSFEPLRRSDDTRLDHLLDAGANPPAGVQIHYYLREQPQEAVRLEIVDVDGHVVRSFDSAADPDVQGARLPSHAGLNRFIWNLRVAGVPPVKPRGNLAPWNRPHGPLVLPGTYQVRLTVDGQQHMQRFEVVPDPRLLERLAELPAQRDLLGQIYHRLGTCNTLINRIGRLEDELGAWRAWTAERDGATTLLVTIDAVLAELGAMQAELIDVNMNQAQLYASGLHEKLNALIEFVDSADRAPAQQAGEVFAELSQQLEQLERRFDVTVGEQLRGLASALEAAGVPRVGASLGSDAAVLLAR